MRASAILSFWRMTIASAHLMAGLRAAADLTASDVVTDLAGAGDLVAPRRTRSRI